ncbi:unnamed protein product [Acanthocheilonema viteae]|uniref:Uncharacterized protein n=1 Tax=Acanthocheilonema viteae TaxID=6277 RepID=A0A498SVR0_ACAVI|nr:unnamed protein product [Acanthocheilonema viteae]
MQETEDFEMNQMMRIVEAEMSPMLVPLPKPIGYEREFMARVAQLTHKDSPACNTMQETEDFEMNQMMRIVEAEMSPMLVPLPKPIGYEREFTSKLARWSQLVFPRPSFVRQTERSALEISSAEPESWTIWSDDRIEEGVTETDSFKETDSVFTDGSVLEADDELSTISASFECNTVSTNTDEVEIVISEGKTAEIKFDAGSENHEARQFSEVTSSSPISSSSTVTETAKCTINGKKFVWNRNALPFVPRNLIDDQNIELQNYRPKTHAQVKIF